MSTSSLTIEALHHSLWLTPILRLLVEYGRNTKATSDLGSSNAELRPELVKVGSAATGLAPNVLLPDKIHKNIAFKTDCQIFTRICVN